MKEMFDLTNKLILAPMAGVTDLPFRLLCKEQGCDVLYTEMVSAKAILYGNKNTEPLMRYEEMDSVIWFRPADYGRYGKKSAGTGI